MFHDFWMPFWTTFGSKSIIRLAIPGVTFFKKNYVFSGPRSGHRFLMDFDGFLNHFGWFLFDFYGFSHLWGTSFSCYSTLFASVSASFKYVREHWHNLKHKWDSFHQFLHRFNRFDECGSTDEVKLLERPCRKSVGWLAGWLVGWLSSSKTVSCPVSTSQSRWSREDSF